VYIIQLNKRHEWITRLPGSFCVTKIKYLASGKQEIYKWRTVVTQPIRASDDNEHFLYFTLGVSGPSSTTNKHG